MDAPELSRPAELLLRGFAAVSGGKNITSLDLTGLPTATQEDIDAGNEELIRWDPPLLEFTERKTGIGQKYTVHGLTEAGREWLRTHPSGWRNQSSSPGE